MSVQPQIITQAGTPQGMVATMADIQRRIADLTAQSGSLAPGSVTGDRIQAGAVTATQIAAGSITSAQIAAGTITATNIAAASITGALIAAGTITASNIAASTITAGQIAASTITATQIAANTITSAQIAAGTITAGQIAANTITAAQIAANTITAGQIAATTITSAQIAAGTITATNIAAATITSTQLATGSVTATQIAAGAVTASAINVSSLSAVSGTMGTVTGGIFQTGTSGSRVMMGSGLTTPSGVTAGVVGIDTGNNVTFSIDANTGNVVLKGTILTGSNGLGNIGGVTQNAILMTTGSNLVGNSDALTTDLTPFVASAGGTAAFDTGTFLTAPRSVKVTNGASAGSPVLASLATGGARIPVTVGTAYSMRAFVFSNLTRTITISMAWYTAAGALISTSTATVTTLPGQWVRAPFDNVTAPATAATVSPSYTITGMAANEVAWLDDFLFVAAPTSLGSAIIANSITASEIAAGTITATQIAANTITASQIAAGAVTTTALAAGSVTTSILAAGAVTASTIAANAIDAMTITGATFQTNSNANTSKILMNSTGVFAYNASGLQVLSIDTNGNLNVTSPGGAVTAATVQTNKDPSVMRAVFDSHGFWAVSSDASGNVSYSNALMTLDPASGIKFPGFTGGTIDLGSVTWHDTNAAGGLIADTYGYKASSTQTIGRLIAVPIGGTVSSNSTWVYSARDTATDSSNVAVLYAPNAAGTSQYQATLSGAGQFSWTTGPKITSGGNYNTAANAQGGIAFINVTQMGTVSGGTSSPASAYLYLNSSQGSLPGFASNAYPVLTTSFNDLYISGAGAFWGYFDGTGYHVNSSKGQKQNPRSLDPQDTLHRIASLELEEWEFKSQPGIRHIGPYAEDFHQKFRLGDYRPREEDRKRPSHAAMLLPADVAGVALAGVQSLYDRVKDLEHKLRDVEHRLFLKEVIG